MRAGLPSKILRSSWLYVAVGGVVLLAVLGLMFQWAYNNNDWVRFHVDEIIAQVHSINHTQPDVVPTPSVLAAAPTFAPTPTYPPTPAPSTATLAASPQPGVTSTPAPTAAPTATTPPLPRKVALT